MRDDSIKNIEQWAQALLDTFDAGERRKFLRQLAIRLRAKTAKNITAQQSPSGEQWEPRKKQRSSIKAKKKMLLGFRVARRLKIHTSGDRTRVVYDGSSARLARVHHLGLRDRINSKDPNSRMYQYAARPLIGITDDDYDVIDELLSKIFDRSSSDVI